MGVALNGDSDVQTLHTSLFVGGLGSAGANVARLRGWLVDRLAEKSFSGNGYILYIYIYIYYIYILYIYIYTHGVSI